MFWKRRWCLSKGIRNLLKIIREMEKNLVERKKSRWSFAIDRQILMIICKRLAHPDDHLQKGWPIQQQIDKWTEFQRRLFSSSSIIQRITSWDFVPNTAKYAKICYFTSQSRSDGISQKWSSKRSLEVLTLTLAILSRLLFVWVKIWVLLRKVATHFDSRPRVNSWNKHGSWKKIVAYFVTYTMWNKGECYFVSSQPSKHKNARIQPQIWSILSIYQNDSDSLPKVCYIN